MNKFKTGQTVKCIKDDPRDNFYGIEDDKRWHIGDKFIINTIDIYPYGIYLNDGNGHNLDAERAEIVK